MLYSWPETWSFWNDGHAIPVQRGMIFITPKNCKLGCIIAYFPYFFFQHFHGNIFMLTLESWRFPVLGEVSSLDYSIPSSFCLFSYSWAMFWTALLVWGACSLTSFSWGGLEIRSSLMTCQGQNIHCFYGIKYSRNLWHKYHNKIKCWNYIHCKTYFLPFLTILPTMLPLLVSIF